MNGGRRRRRVLVTAAPPRELGRAARGHLPGAPRGRGRRSRPGHRLPGAPEPARAAPVEPMLGGHPRIRLVDPIDYLDNVAAMKACSFVVTDSGGIQEEAPVPGEAGARAARRDRAARGGRGGHRLARGHGRGGGLQGGRNPGDRPGPLRKHGPSGQPVRRRPREPAHRSGDPASPGPTAVAEPAAAPQRAARRKKTGRKARSQT